MSDLPYQIACAVYLILIKNDQLLLLRRFNTGYKDGFYAFIAGHLESGETIFDAVIREANEEAGITVKKSDLIPVHTVHRQSEKRPYIDFFFIAKSWENEPRINEPDKCDELIWADLNNLPSNTVSLIPHILKQIDLDSAFSLHGWD